MDLLPLLVFFCVCMGLSLFLWFLSSFLKGQIFFRTKSRLKRSPTSPKIPWRENGGKFIQTDSRLFFGVLLFFLSQVFGLLFLVWSFALNSIPADHNVRGGFFLFLFLFFVVFSLAFLKVGRRLD